MQSKHHLSLCFSLVIGAVKWGNQTCILRKKNAVCLCITKKKRHASPKTWMNKCFDTHNTGNRHNIGICLWEDRENLNRTIIYQAEWSRQQLGILRTRVTCCARVNCGWELQNPWSPSLYIGPQLVPVSLGANMDSASPRKGVCAEYK